MASLCLNSHEREAQSVLGTIMIEDNEVYCEFYYSRDSKGVRITSVIHGDVDLKKVFIFSSDIFTSAEEEIEEMLAGEEAPEESTALESGYQTGGI